MILRPVGGIGNRLRAMMSRLEPGLVVQWPVDWECAFAEWEDAFEPIDGVTIFNVVRNPDDTFDERCDVETCDTAPLKPGWTAAYRHLKPAPNVKRRIGWGMPYDAIHVRRTDHAHVIPIEAKTWDHEFESFCARREGKPIYIATDNAATQRHYSRLYGNFWSTRIETGTEKCMYGDHTRHTSLADSVVDIFMCAEAERFMGTRGSSFTDTINILRGLR